MSDKTPDTNDFIDDAREEFVGMAKQGAKHPSTKPVLTGAAVGAVAGALLPVITWPIGLAAGAGYVFYNRVKK